MRRFLQISLLGYADLHVFHLFYVNFTLTKLLILAKPSLTLTAAMIQKAYLTRVFSCASSSVLAGSVVFSYHDPGGGVGSVTLSGTNNKNQSPTEIHSQTVNQELTLRWSDGFFFVKQFTQL